LLRYVVYLTSRRDQAEDLVQETWIHVLERTHQFDGSGRFEAWLFSIARHLTIDFLRRQQAAKPGQPVDDGNPDALLEAPAPDQTSPFAAAARSEDAALIAVAMECLAPIYREALLLRFQEDLSLEEIAGVAGAPVATVASRIRRGLAILRTHLERSGNAA
jgi:RNA polymerase sigma-70 factor (ECF subfamily)